MSTKTSLKKFDNSINSSNNSINEKNTYQKIHDDVECLICFEDIDVEKEHVLCETCLKYCHFDCYQQWKRKRMRSDKMTCIHCNQATLLDYRNITNCFFSRIWGPNYKYVKY